MPSTRCQSNLQLEHTWLVVVVMVVMGKRWVRVCRREVSAEGVLTAYTLVTSTVKVRERDMQSDTRAMPTE